MQTPSAERWKVLWTALPGAASAASTGVPLLRPQRGEDFRNLQGAEAANRGSGTLVPRAAIFRARGARTGHA